MTQNNLKIKSLNSDRLVQDVRAKGLSFFTAQCPAVIGEELYQEMRELNRHSPQRNIRVCLHSGADARHHDMIILQPKHAYIRPHHHPDKSETIHIIEGELGIIRFGAQGDIIGSQRLIRSEILRIEDSGFYFLLPLSQATIYHESKPGPWDPTTDSVYPDWAPLEGDELQVAQFIQRALETLG